MNKLTAVAVLITGISLTALVATAQDAGAPKPASSGTEEIKNIATLGAGVHRVKKDERGCLKSCVVVGQARISKVLGGAKGLITARKNARLDADKEFVKWVKTNVKAIQTTSNSTAFFMLGKTEGTTTTGTEEGASLETSVEAISTAAEGAVRGLQVIGMDQDGQNEILTVVLGWSPENAALAGKAGAVNEKNYNFDSSDTGGGTRTSSDSTPEVKIQSKTAISDDAKDFLGK